ncbi:MAG: DUF4783 domain-containing protein [Flavobacteriales bacterium]
MKQMKQLLLSLLIATSSASMMAQTDITPKVTEAIKKGDAAALAAYFMDQIELTLPANDGTFNKAEAQKLIAKFFADYGVTSFVIKHQGTSKLDDQYRIGDLVTNKGTFRVTFFMRKSGASLLIKQLKIEEE